MADIKWLVNPGDRIDHFTVVSHIGAGGMGQVVLCRDTNLKRDVALKLIEKENQTADETVVRFFQEGQLLARLNHPNVTTIYSFGETEGFVYMAMEYVKGDSLHSLIRHNRLSFSEMREITLDVAMGLREAHKLGIVHRDIKPANILVDTNGRAKLIDFGIAKSLVSASDLNTRTGTIVGTLNYIAPEVLADNPATQQSDIYALGLVLYEMITGATPFSATSLVGTLDKINRSSLDYPGHLEPLLPIELRKAIDRALKKDVALRTASIDDFIRDVEAIDLSHIPKSFLKRLRRIEVGNWRAVRSHLEDHSIPRAEWPFIVSHALSTASPESRAINPAIEDPSSTQKIELYGSLDLNTSLIESSIKDFRQIRDRARANHRRPKVESKKPALGVAVSAFAVLAVALAAFALYPKIHSEQVVTGIKPLQRNAASVVPKDKPVEREQGISASHTAIVKRLRELGVGTILEPERPVSQDTWPPVPFPNPRLGMRLVFGESQIHSTGTVEREKQLWELVAFDRRTLKWRGSKIDANGNEIGAPFYVWNRVNGNLASMIRSENHHIFGDSLQTIVGRPEALFPLRKDKAVFFERVSESHRNTPEKYAEFSMKTFCIVGDKEYLDLRGGQHDVVRIDCYLNNGLRPDIYYYSEKFGISIVWRAQRGVGAGKVMTEFMRELEEVLDLGAGLSYADYLKGIDSTPVVDYTGKPNP